MQLPERVKRLIEEQADRVGFPALKRAASAMSDRYRDARGTAAAGGEEQSAAYLVTRMPATFAAAYMVLEEVRARIGPVASVLDLGAGSGAASLAAQAHFPEARLTMIERDPALAGAARQWLPDAEMIRGDARQTLPERDLVIAAYSFSEIGGAVTRLWAAARVALVVIEPGTPAGFALVRKARQQLLADGAHMVAPCPAPLPCPIVEPDWCHFGARVERSSLHRRIKDGDLGYEDEKFSYVAVAHAPVELAAARILRRPKHQPGLIAIDLCTPTGLEARRVTKRDRDAYRAARRAGWGEVL